MNLLDSPPGAARLDKHSGRKLPRCRGGGGGRVHRFHRVPEERERGEGERDGGRRRGYFRVFRERDLLLKGFDTRIAPRGREGWSALFWFSLKW